MRDDDAKSAASEQAAGLRRLADALAERLEEKQKFELASDIRWHIQEVIAATDRSLDDSARFNVLYFTQELVESAFFAAVRTGLTLQDVERAKKDAAREHGATGGLKGGETRLKNALEWRVPCLNMAKDKRGKAPEISTTTLARLAYQSIKTPVDEPTILKFLRECREHVKLSALGSR